ncbi:uncharacterized protein [Spinacia oleracea]|uniref:TELO2 ARM repeat domain-containing protein n=1 Tax=Spinacia oleracea TaxID=3562 RepID=A0ABM3QJC5_SPIOL|nr:uncharacterized protein LOC130459856 [Spinacia oleracea]
MVNIYEGLFTWLESASFSLCVMETYLLSISLYPDLKLGNYGLCLFLTKVLSLFFQSITIQLLDGAEEKSWELYDKEVLFHGTDVDDTFQFVAEMFARICRRGSTELLVNEVILRIRRRVQRFLLSHKGTITENSIKSNSDFQFWFLMIEILRDAYVVEKMIERILHQLAAECEHDTEAYWILWILFHRAFQHQITIRSILRGLRLMLVRKLMWFVSNGRSFLPPSIYY